MEQLWPPITSVESKRRFRKVILKISWTPRWGEGRLPWHWIRTVRKVINVVSHVNKHIPILLLFSALCSSSASAAQRGGTTPPVVSVTSPLLILHTERHKRWQSQSPQRTIIKMAKVEFYDGTTLKATNILKPYDLRPTRTRGPLRVPTTERTTGPPKPTMLPVTAGSQRSCVRRMA